MTFKPGDVLIAKISWTELYKKGDIVIFNKYPSSYKHTIAVKKDGKNVVFMTSSFRKATKAEKQKALFLDRLEKLFDEIR